MKKPSKKASAKKTTAATAAEKKFYTKQRTDAVSKQARAYNDAGSADRKYYSGKTKDSTDARKKGYAYNDASNATMKIYDKLPKNSDPAKTPYVRDSEKAISADKKARPQKQYGFK